MKNLIKFMIEQTAIIIKPDGVKKKLVGECLKRFEKANLKIKALKLLKLKKTFARKLYSNIKPKLNSKLFDAIINYICSSDVVIGLLKGENAVARTRKIIGPTNPKETPKGTIRGDFATDDLIAKKKQNKATKNIIHASGSKEEAKFEIELIKELI